MSKLMVGSARIGENGEATGGAPGDQTGREVCTQEYYPHKLGWYVVRPKDVKLANGLAASMLAACNNNNIGYNQNTRLGIVEGTEKYGSIKGIKEKVNSDCSSTARACCIDNGFDPGNFRTYNEVSYLEKTGKFEKAKSVGKDTVLYNGDILVTKTSGHTVIVTSGNPRKVTKEKGSKEKEPKKNEPKKTEPKKTSTKTKSTKVKVKVNGLRIRKGPGTKYDVVGHVAKGNRYSIVKKSGSWGQLKNNIGWICISSKYVTEV